MASRSLSPGRLAFAALFVVAACQGAKFGSADEPRGGAAGSGGSNAANGGKSGASGNGSGGRGGSAGKASTGGTGRGGDTSNAGAPEGGEGNQPGAGGSQTAGKGGAGHGGAGHGGSANAGGAGAFNASGRAGSAGSAGNPVVLDCPALPPPDVTNCTQEELGTSCDYGDEFNCLCDYRPELNTEPTWFCEGCPPKPVTSYSGCAPVDVSCTYEEMTCTCMVDGSGGTWRCEGCPPELPSSNSCVPGSTPAGGCSYGNALCQCEEARGFYCTGGCDPAWFSFTDVSNSDHTHPAWSSMELAEVVAKINAGNNFVYTLPSSSGGMNDHSHQVPFNGSNLWILQSGLGEVTISTGLGDGHEWLVECMP